MTHGVLFFCPGRPDNLAVLRRFADPLAAVGAELVPATPAGPSSVYEKLVYDCRDASGLCVPRMLQRYAPGRVWGDGELEIGFSAGA